MNELLEYFSVRFSNIFYNKVLIPDHKDNRTVVLTIYSEDYKSCACIYEGYIFKYIKDIRDDPKTQIVENFSHLQR